VCAVDADSSAALYCKKGAGVPKEENGAAGDNTGFEGSCTPVRGVPHGTRAACMGAKGADPCTATTCNGADPTGCSGSVGAEVACRAASCANGVQTQGATCAGTGMCPQAVSVSCQYYACESASPVCRMTCAADADCALGARCESGACVPGASCAPDGHSVVDPAGHKTDCTPYLCAKGACTVACKSVADCAAPSVCDPSGQCVAPAGGAGGDGGGCAIARRARPVAPPLAAAFAILGWLGARRRRSRARGGA
jgi:hypothetical protein